MTPNSVGGRWHFGLSCPHCNDSVIAPHSSVYLSEERVRHFWCCESCDYQTESIVDLRIEVAKLSKRAPNPVPFVV